MIDIEYEGHKTLYMYYRLTANQTLSFLETRKKKEEKKKEGKILIRITVSVRQEPTKWGISLPLPQEMLFCTFCGKVSFMMQ